jgi:hypothetical protein
MKEVFYALVFAIVLFSFMKIAAIPVQIFSAHIADSVSAGLTPTR